MPDGLVQGAGESHVALDERRLLRVCRHVRAHDAIHCGSIRDTPRRPVELQIDLCHETTECAGARNKPVVDPANMSLMRVSARDDRDGRIETLNEIDDGSAEIDALVRAASVESTLVDEYDDRVGALRAQLGHERIDDFRLVAKFHAFACPRGKHGGGGFEREADEGHLHAVVLPDAVRREKRLARCVHDDIRREERKARAAKVRPGPAALGWTPAALHAPQVGYAAIELVVADTIEVEPGGVHRFDHGLVVERRREQWRRTEEIARRDEHEMRALLTQSFDHRRELRHAACADRALHRGRGPITADALRRRSEPAVKVVDRGNLDSTRCGADAAPHVPEPSATTSSIALYRASSARRSSDVESEVYDVAVLHHVLAPSNRYFPAFLAAASLPSAMKSS